jgi:hypothetical protein
MQQASGSAEAQVRALTWMTTSEESSTLYSSPQMRFDCPFWYTLSVACQRGALGQVSA